METKTVEKAWGKEEWLALTDDYCFKRIEIKAGHLTSLQYHEKKEETNYLLSGEAIFWKIEGHEVLKFHVKPGFKVHLVPKTVHRFEAITDIVLMECSNKYVDDVVRLEDAYGRKCPQEK